MKFFKKYRSILLYTLVFAIGIIISVIIGSLYRQNLERRDYLKYIQTACLLHSDPKIWHVHVYMQIIINGKEAQIPKRLNYVGDCMRPIHTHSDRTDIIHLMFAHKVDVRIGDLFFVWGKKFSKEQIFDNKVDNTHQLIVTVNGHPNYDFENLLMHDQDKIVIEYKKIK